MKLSKASVHQFCVGAAKAFGMTGLFPARLADEAAGAVSPVESPNTWNVWQNRQSDFSDAWVPLTCLVLQMLAENPARRPTFHETATQLNSLSRMIAEIQK